MTKLVQELKFQSEWYERIIKSSNEKVRLAKFIKDVFLSKQVESLLEVGMGTQPIFSKILSDQVNEYTIIERESISSDFRVPPNVNIMKGDFEIDLFLNKFDLIILSHVIYYFSDLENAVQKSLDLLKEGGKAIFVVNGVESDYARAKEAFSEITGISFTYTYDRLLKSLRDREYVEHTVQTYITFNSYEHLYSDLQLFFDLFPNEYLSSKKEIVRWLKNNIRGDRFLMNQKVIEITKSNDI